MIWGNRNRLLVIISLVLAIVSSEVSLLRVSSAASTAICSGASSLMSSAAPRPRKMQRMVTGTWGGQHISLEISGRSASIEFDCASGTIDAPLTLDSKGHFTWRGYYNRQHGGPIRRDENSIGQPAMYTGWIKGDSMTLTVTLAATREAFGTYTLTRGSQGRVFKCR